MGKVGRGGLGGEKLSGQNCRLIHLWVAHSQPYPCHPCQHNLHPVTLVNTTIPLSPLATQLMRPLSIQPKPCHPVLLSHISSLAAPLSPPCHHVIISEWRILSLNPTLVTTTRHECFPRVAQPLQFHSFQHEWTSVWDQPRL